MSEQTKAQHTPTVDALRDAHDVLLAIVRKSYLKSGRTTDGKPVNPHEDCHVHPSLIEAARLMVGRLAEVDDAYSAEVCCAVNCHAGLLEACKTALDGLYSYRSVKGNCSAMSERDLLRSAIARAEGRQV